MKIWPKSMDLLRSVLVRQPLDKLKKLPCSNRFYQFRKELIMPDHRMIAGLTALQMFEVFGELTDEIPELLDRFTVEIRAIFLQDDRLTFYHEQKLDELSHHCLRNTNSPIPLDQAKISCHMTNYAAKTGNLTLLQYLVDECFFIDEPAFICAARAKNTKILAYLSTLPQLRKPKKVTEIFAELGEFELLKWALSQGFPLGTLTMSNLAKSGRLDILRWLKPNYVIPTIVANYAAENGHLEMLKWYAKEVGPVDSNICNDAAKNGHRHVIEWALQNGLKINYYTAAAAINSGDLEFLKWLKEKGCEFNITAFRQAAVVANLQILKWLKENNCQVDEEVTNGAARSGKLEVVQWLHEQNSPTNDIFTVNGVISGNVELTCWQKSAGYPFYENILIYAASHQRKEMMRWLISEGCLVSTGCVTTVCAWGDLEIFKLTFFKCKEVDSKAWINELTHGHIHIIIWLYSSGYFKKEIRAMTEMCSHPVIAYWRTNLVD